MKSLLLTLGLYLVADAQTMGVQSKTRVLIVGVLDYQDEKITDLENLRETDEYKKMLQKYFPK